MVRKKSDHHKSILALKRCFHLLVSGHHSPQMRTLSIAYDTLNRREEHVCLHSHRCAPHSFHHNHDAAFLRIELYSLSMKWVAQETVCQVWDSQSLHLCICLWQLWPKNQNRQSYPIFPLPYFSLLQSLHRQGWLHALHEAATIPSGFSHGMSSL